MKAIVQDAYGAPDVLELRDIDRPRLADDEVLVRVHTAGVDPAVWHLMTGLPYPVRLAGYGLRAPKQSVPGLDVAGIVEAVGRQVTRFRAGDEVFGVGTGTYAEYARAREDRLAPKPADLTLEQAAVLAISGLTALQGLRDHAGVEPGQHVLIVGASGGVGSYAVQIAKAYDAHVTGVCRTSKVDLVRSLGADDVVDYTRGEFLDGQGRYDAILDIGGGSSLTRLRDALTDRGRLVIVGGEFGGRWLGGTDRLARARLLSGFVSQRLVTFVSKSHHRDLLALTDLVEAGRVMPALDRTYPLPDAARAIGYVHDGQARGKVALSVA